MRMLATAALPHSLTSHSQDDEDDGASSDPLVPQYCDAFDHLSLSGKLSPGGSAISTNFFTSSTSPSPFHKEVKIELMHDLIPYPHSIASSSYQSGRGERG
ncbi:unnamed protein product, partial [Mesorhabditis belari]|uniref:Uncharacterized protein n=1 Tax=Mesorhabditis belari TaxID=2138241 RepID=A0AAF3J5V5_9BILA